jgi:hypothetical protein
MTSLTQNFKIRSFTHNQSKYLPNEEQLGRNKYIVPIPSLTCSFKKALFLSLVPYTNVCWETGKKLRFRRKILFSARLLRRSSLTEPCLRLVFGFVSSVSFQPKEPKSNLLRWPKPRWSSKNGIHFVTGSCTNQNYFLDNNQSHTHLSHSQTSPLLTSSIHNKHHSTSSLSLGVPVPRPTSVFESLKFLSFSL